MSHRRVNITYNTVEVVDLVPQFDDKYIGEVVDNNHSSDIREYEKGKNGNVTPILNNEQVESLYTVEEGDTVEVSQVEGRNKKQVLGPVKLLDTALDENNYDSFNLIILRSDISIDS